MALLTDEPTVPAIESDPQARPRLRLRPDRRDLAAREALLQRVVAEFREVPGLCLTLPQGCRVFGLPEDVGLRIFNGLVEGDALQRVGSYYGLLRTEFVGKGFITRALRHN